VELGVAEGGSARELREVMALDGTLHRVDPCAPGRLHLGFSCIVAGRVVNSITIGQVNWIRQRSYEAACRWTEPLDFLFIDGDHSFDGVVRDWDEWMIHVAVGGHVALHDARTFPGGWAQEGTGPVILAALVEDNVQWELVGPVDSTVVFERGCPL
jgi:hypothetical protein